MPVVLTLIELCQRVFCESLVKRESVTRLERLAVGRVPDVALLAQGKAGDGVENLGVVEARFDITRYELESFFAENGFEYDAGECILRRELYVSGKSRAFINDSPASLSQMKELGEKLIDIHSQHQNLLLNREGFQMNVLDILAKDETELALYQSLYADYRKVSSELEECIVQLEKNRQDEDYIRFQLEQLEEVNLQIDEQELLEEEAETLSHAEDIKSGLYKVDMLIATDETNLLSAMKECIQTLQGVSKVYDPAQEWMDRLDSCFVELKDLSHEVGNAAERIEFNPSRLEEVNNRLNLLYSLQQKHHVSSVGELIDIAKDYRNQLNAITSSDDRILELNPEAQEKNIKKFILA